MSISKRWVRGSLLFTIAVVLVAESLFIFFLVSGYYNNVRQTMESQLRTLRVQLSVTASDSQQSKQLRMRRLVEQFDMKAQYELMLVNQNGRVVSSSSGVLPAAGDLPQDISEILSPAAGEFGEYIGLNENGEKVMAITMRTPYTSDSVVALRLVTSLVQVDEAIRSGIMWSIALALVIILASVLSGIFFIRSIVQPLQKVESTAALISQGNFDTRIENDSQDEIGSLCKTINHMAEELSKSERMKNEFISSVSHELRTPLTSIKGWTETIGRLPDCNDPSFRRGVDIIAGEADRLYDMVEELLDFSRMQSGIVLEKELLDLAAEVEDAVLIAEQRAKHLNLSILYDAPQLPVAVMGERNRIRQVLLNVIDNAVKYSPAGGKITLEVSADESMAQVTVRDEGPGIAPEDIENLRVKFYKGKNALRGSGIGLAVVDEIMKAHEGALIIESEQGQGTCVILRWPLAEMQTA